MHDSVTTMVIIVIIIENHTSESTKEQKQHNTFRMLYIQWNPYNADTLRNKKSVLIIGVSTFQRYGLYANTLKPSSSVHEKYQYKTNLQR